MHRRMIGLASLGLAVVLTACNGPSSSTAPIARTQSPAELPEHSEAPASPLFHPAGWLSLPPKRQEEADPIVLRQCHLTVIDKEDIPSQVDGVVAFIGVEIPKDSPAPVDPRDVYVHKRTGKKYLKAKPRSLVKKGQTVVVLDDDNAFVELQIAEGALEAAHADVVAAEKTITHVEALTTIAKQALDKGAGSYYDWKAAQANVARYESEKISKIAAVQKAKGERERAELRLKYHTISAAIDGEVASINKEIGEGIKATETLLTVHNLDRLRVEGPIDLQYTKAVTQGMEVTVEPTVLIGPSQTLSGHKSVKITGLAVSNDPRRPLIVSGAEDGVVLVWDRKEPKARWPHRGAGAIRAIACTGRHAKQSLALTGADDGIARIWDLTKLNLDQPIRVLSEGSADDLKTFRHPNGVSAAAFSPDGEYCVTADGDRGIYLWKTATGERMYRFPLEHTSPVTTLYFTPQCRVVSVGRDNLALIWLVGPDKAGVEHTFDHRSGDVAQLGVTEDGNWMMVDHDKTRLHITHVGKALTERVIESLGESTHFSRFALFSPPLNAEGNRLLLTSSNQGHILQLWRHAPADERDREILRLVPPNTNAGATVAAFSPSVDNGFVVVGTDRGDIHLWPLPSQSEIERRWTARVTNIEQTLDPTGRSVKISAEMKNDPADSPYRLRAGTTTVMVIPPPTK